MQIGGKNRSEGKNQSNRANSYLKASEFERDSRRSQLQFGGWNHDNPNSAADLISGRIDGRGHALFANRITI